LERERRFPIRTMTALSGAFAQAGLQFFKRDKTVVHVAVARPHHLDLETSAVQPGIRRIIEWINANPKTTRKKLIEALAPSPVAPVVPVVPVSPAPAAPEPSPVEGAAESNPPTPAAEPVAAQTTEAAGTAATAAPATTPAEPTAEQQTVLSDLHWLIHQGHVIEFASGVLETAKKPLPRPEPAAATAEKPSKPEPRKDRPPKRIGRYVWDNQGLLPLPAAQPALVG
ncbi:MAG: hypothetical protein KIT22_14365, partial [Verrucomicrobiae bacterium]|nr:hypothetical protein [Verrucomicrobiae bacterium]